MKKIFFYSSIVLVFFGKFSFAQEKPKEFVVYQDKMSKENHYAPSGWMGDWADLKFDDMCKENPYSGQTCIQIVYSAKKSQGQGWAGIYWQNPPNNWGSKKGGFDLTGFNKLTFYARGQKGGEVIQKFKIGGISGTYPDSADVESQPIELKDTWQKYTINLSGKDLSYISGGFCWIITSDQNPKGATFYLDDIKYEFEEGLKPITKVGQNMPFYVYSDAGSATNHFIPSGWMGDWGDVKLDQNSNEDPYLGDTCIKIIYSGQCSQGQRWAGIYWQNPANNWGEKDGGFDLSKATKFTFWARGQKGGERIEEFKIGGLTGEFADSDSASIGPIVLDKEWRQYSIDLKGKDMSYISGGFCWAANIDVNPNLPVVFYLDEMKYE